MAPALMNFDQLPDDAFVRLADLAHNPRRRGFRPVLLGVSDASVYRMVREGQFPKPTHIGRAALWRLGDVRAWLAAQGAAAQREDEVSA